MRGKRAGDIDAEILDHIGPGADGRALPGRVRGGSEEGALRDDLRAPPGQALLEQGVGGAGDNAHRAGILRLDPLNRADEDPGDRGTGGLLAGHPLRAEAECHILGGHHVAIMEAHPLAQREIDDRGRLALPGGCERGLEREIVAVVDAEQPLEEVVADAPGDVGELAQRFKALRRTLHAQPQHRTRSLGLRRERGGGETGDDGAAVQGKGHAGSRRVIGRARPDRRLGAAYERRPLASRPFSASCGRDRGNGIV